jgi:hypothetical protein
MQMAALVVAVFMAVAAAAEWEILQEALVDQAVLQVLGVLEVLMQQTVGTAQHRQEEAAAQEVPQQLLDLAAQDE